MAANCVLKVGSGSTWLLISPEWNRENEGWEIRNGDDMPVSPVSSSGQTLQLPSMMQLLSQGRPAATLEGFVLESAKVGDTGMLRFPGGTGLAYAVVEVDWLATSDTQSSAVARLQLSYG